MKTLCNFVSLLLWIMSCESRTAKNQDDRSLKAEISRLDICSGENLKIGNGKKLDCEDICFLVFGRWPLLKLMSFLFFCRLCVTRGGCTGLVCLNTLYACCKVSGETCIEKKMHKRSSIVSQNIKELVEDPVFFPIVLKVNQCNHKAS